MGTDYPLVPGNVVNASSFPFPVFVKVLDGISSTDILTFNQKFVEPIADAGQQLVNVGVRAVVGACGSFANYQRDVAAALPVPVYMSVMLQVPLIQQGLRPDQSIAVLTFNRSALTPRVYSQCAIEYPDRLHLYSTDDMQQSKLMRRRDPAFVSDTFSADLAALAADIVVQRSDTGAFLIQCSDLPPYAAAIQRATGLPVFDMNTLITWAYHAVVQRPFQE